MSLEPSSVLPAAGIAAAALTGFVVAPALANLAWPRARTTHLSSIIPFARIDADGRTVRTTGPKGGGCFIVISLDGFRWAGKSEDERNEIFGKCKAFVDSLGSEPADLRLISRRTPIAIKRPPATTPLGDKISAAWNARFENAFATQHFIVVTTTATQQRYIVTIERTLKDLLRPYGPRVLTLEGDTPDAPSPLLSFLARHINGYQLDVMPARHHLADLLSYANVRFDSDGTIVHSDGATTLYCAAVGIKAWPEFTTSDIVAAILQIPAQLELHLRVHPYEKSTAIATTTWRAKQSMLAVFNPLIQREWQSAKDMIHAGQEGFFQVELTTYVYAASREDLADKIDLVRSAFGNQIIRSVHESMLAERLWRGRIPGHSHFCRPYHLLSSNIADLMPMPAEPLGRDSSQWGPNPVQYLPTPSGSPYGFVFHKSRFEDLAHWLVIGPSGGGKSTLMMFLLYGALAAYPHLRAFVFDRMLGTKTAVDCWGGDYLIPDGGQLELNPFLTATTAQDHKFLALFLRMLTQKHDDDAIQHITTAVADLMDVNPERRTLRENWQRLFPVGPLRDSVRKWAIDESYGTYFNGKRDALALDGARLTAFDMTNMRADPQLSAAMTYYIMHRIRATVLAAPTPHIVFIDEAPDMLRNEFFAQQVEVLLREHRKLQGSVILAAQDVGAFTKSAIAETLLNNIAGVLLLPNPNAREEDYEKLRLAPDEWDFIKGRSRVADRLPRSVLVKREGESVILNTDFSALGPYLRAFSSAIQDRQDISELKERFGVQWLSHFVPL